MIDLRKVSLELVQQAQDADLVVLEGMGRSIETNLHVHLQCDVLKLGMIKHPEVGPPYPDRSSFRASVGSGVFERS